MTTIDTRQLFEYALQECRRHQTRMQQALAVLQPVLPLDADRVEVMDEEGVRASDQFILRFTKLQDAMGSRLYPAILRVLGEPAEEIPMLDRLHRLEKLVLFRRHNNGKSCVRYATVWRMNIPMHRKRPLPLLMQRLVLLKS